VENMSGLMSPFYRIKRQRYRDKTYYYLYKEWYDPEAKKKRSKLIGRCDELERLVVELEKLKQGVDNHWCGGWDLNPRRPTPAGLEPWGSVAEASKGIASFCPSQVMVMNTSSQPPAQSAISGKSDEGQSCLALSDSLLQEFVDWLRGEEGTGEKTVRNYTSCLRRALNIQLCGKSDVGRYFELAGMSKKCYEAFRRLLTFVEKKREGFEALVQQLKKAMPRKPRSQADTYVPSDEEILKLRSYVEKLGEPYTTIYRVLVATGCRLSEAAHLLKSFNSERLVKVAENVCRYHIDLQRKSKNVLVMYLPREVVESIQKLDKHIPHVDNIAKVFEKSGLSAKYIRKWFRQTLKKLKVDPEVIEFLQGRISALGIGAKHYTDLVALADEAYPKIIYPHIKNYL